MNVTPKRALIFFLALTFCWGSPAAAVQAREPEAGITAETLESASAQGLFAEMTDQEEAVPAAGNIELPDGGTVSAGQPDDTAENNLGDPTPQTEGDEDGEDRSDEEVGEAPDVLDADNIEVKGPETADIEKLLAETPEENIVYTAAELEAWCRKRAYTYAGGRVSLGAVVTISETFDVYGAGRIVIDTGSHGLIYDGGKITISGLEITGEGVDVPVLDIYSVIEYGYFWESGWNDTLQQLALTVTATGRDGEGGVALRVRRDDGYTTRYNSYTAEPLIRSSGAGAVGLYLDEPLDVYGLKIEAAGEGSAAVYAPQGADLYYCKLAAEGAGATVVSGSGSITLDTCAANPEPQNAQVIDRRIIDASGSRLYRPVPQYGSGDYYSEWVTFLLSGGDGYPAVREAFWIEWNAGPQGVDTDVLGRTVIEGSLSPPFQGLGLEDDFALELIIDVRDPALPCIYDILFRKNITLGAYVYLCFWEIYDPAEGNVILWRSDDGGDVWYDFTYSPDIVWDGDGLLFYYGEITATVILQLEVAGAGESNMVTLYSLDGDVYGGPGGDRDGGDRKTASGSNGGNGSDGENGNGGGDGNGSGTGNGGKNTTGDGNSPGNGNPSGAGDSSDGGNGTGDENPNEGENTTEDGDFPGDGSPSPGENSSANGNSAGAKSGSGNDGNSSAKDAKGGNENNNNSESSPNLANEKDETDGAEQPTSASEPPAQNESDAKTAPVDMTQTAATGIKTPTTSQEWEDENTVAISGRRLAVMLEANNRDVTFIKNGLQVAVAPADLLALGLDGNQLFVVEIRKLKGNSFSVCFSAGGAALSGLPFTVGIGAAAFDGLSLASAVCLNEKGEVLPSAYDPATGRLSVTMTGPGVFTLQGEQIAKAAAFAPGNPLLASLLAGGAVLVPGQEERPAGPASPLKMDMTGVVLIGVCAVSLPTVLVWRRRRLARR